MFYATEKPSLGSNAILVVQHQKIPASHPKRPDFLQAFKNIRKVVDLFEPHHIWQFGSPDGHWLWWLAYGFSVVRWRKEILQIQPSLEHDIMEFEEAHRLLICDELEHIDKRSSYTHDQRMNSAVVLNIIYEAVYSLKSCHKVDRFAINGYLKALRDRLSHLYCVLLPKKNGVKRHERKSYNRCARILLAFPRTLVLLPPEWQHFVTSITDDMVLDRQKDSLVQSPHQHSSVLPQSSGPSKILFPCLEEYVPAQFLTVFGFDARTFCREKLGLNGEYKLFDYVEHILSNELFYPDEDIVPLIVLLAPCALSLMTKIILQKCEGERSQMERRITVRLIVAQSLVLCEIFIAHLVAKNEFLTWTQKSPCLSAAMYTWAENDEDGLLQKFSRLSIARQ
jgi:hypothetical protein